MRVSCSRRGSRRREATLPRSARIDSPRGTFTLSPQHNPVQDIYLREARGGQNVVIGVAAAQLADPGTGCRMPST